MAKLEGTSPERAISLLRRADENGVTLAARALSQRYAAGEGATRDMHEASRWLERGAAEGDPWAHTDLGRMYWQANKDYGIDKNWALALFISLLPCGCSESAVTPTAKRLANRCSIAPISPGGCRWTGSPRSGRPHRLGKQVSPCRRSDPRTHPRLPQARDPHKLAPRRIERTSRCRRRSWPSRCDRCIRASSAFPGGCRAATCPSRASPRRASP